MVIGKNYDINKVQYTIIIKTATAGDPAVAVLFGERCSPLRKI